MTTILEARNLAVTAGKRAILRNISFAVPQHQVFGVIGASGAGKSTLLKSLNRLLELNPNFHVSGEVLLAGESIYAEGIDVDELRGRIGIIFQQPVIFPKGIYQNVIFGTRHFHTIPRKQWPDVAERALTEVALWNEVKDRLHDSALRLSVGQQQRLCLARALAVDPAVILMDEPTSSLDTKSTEAIEELILRLKRTRTIVLVTHNLGQARRIADRLVCIAVRDGVGEIAQCGPCAEVMANQRYDDFGEVFDLPQRKKLHNDDAM
jgi:phosphate transport system ATP-binding protein